MNVIFEQYMTEARCDNQKRRIIERSMERGGGNGGGNGGEKVGENSVENDILLHLKEIESLVIKFGINKVMKEVTKAVCKDTDDET